MNDAPDGIRLPERLIPFPRSISDAARSALQKLVNAAGVPVNALIPTPSPEDAEGWLALKAAAGRFYDEALER